MSANLLIFFIYANSTKPLLIETEKVLHKKYYSIEKLHLVNWLKVCLCNLFHWNSTPPFNKMLKKWSSGPS